MMKTAKAPPPPAEAFSSRRSQPVRQTRTNPQRTSSVLKRTLTRDSLTGAAGQDRPIDIFPAITHFADTMTALPKELVKHFTLLKEVDAKVHLPQESLFRLIDEALNSPMPEPSRSSNNTPAGVASASAPMSTQNSSSGTAVNGQPPAVPSAAESSNSATFAPSDIRRRQLFRQVAFEIKEMLVSLEEKNHVIATANEALQKQLARIDDVWIPLENEFSDEAKWGSTTHWAYQENRAGRADNAQAERSRREGAASLSAAAQKIAEEMAQRSDSRKQAMAMKRSLKTQQHQESDFDDHEGKQKGESSKKAGGAKSRKPPNADSPATVGLGISNAAAVNGNPPAKRRKVEKTSNGGAAAERAMSSVFGPNGAKPKTNSPRETPAPEAGAKKRKALPGGSGQPKKRYADRTLANPCLSLELATDTMPAEPGTRCPLLSPPRPSLALSPTPPRSEEPRQRRLARRGRRPLERDKTRRSPVLRTQSLDRRRRRPTSLTGSRSCCRSLLRKQTARAYPTTRRRRSSRPRNPRSPNQQTQSRLPRAPSQRWWWFGRNQSSRWTKARQRKKRRRRLRSCRRSQPRAGGRASLRRRHWRPSPRPLGLGCRREPPMPQPLSAVTRNKHRWTPRP